MEVAYRFNVEPDVRPKKLQNGNSEDMYVSGMQIIDLKSKNSPNKNQNQGEKQLEPQSRFSLTRNSTQSSPELLNQSFAKSK